MNLRSPRAVFAILAIALVTIVVVYAIYTAFSPPGPVAMQVPSAFVVGGRSFAITATATNPSEREAGLMNSKIMNTTIMLFVFPSPGIYDFWMRDTNASLDIIWVSASGGSGRVVYVHADSQPCLDSLTCPSFGPSSPANYVIEARAGFTQANGILVGSTIQFEAPTMMQVS